MIIQQFRRYFARQVRKNNLLNKIKDDIFEDFPRETNNNAEEPKNDLKIQEKEIVQHQTDQLKSDQPMDQETIKFVRETLLYQGEDQFPDQYAFRPEKDVVWGLGGELLRIKQQIFDQNELPNPDQIKAFLELEQCKDISITDMRDLGRTDCPNHSIIATTYSERHTHRVATNLVKQIKQLKVPMSIKPSIHGRKDDEWVLVCLQEIDVHLFLEDARQEMNLEYRWKNPISEEEYEIREQEIQMIKTGKYKPLEY